MKGKDNFYLVVACMDEDLDYGPKVVVLGTAGSLITQIGTGDQEVYPDKKRKLIKKTRSGVFAAFQMVADELGLSLVVTSHEGCGAGAVQGVEGQEQLEKTTKAMCEELDFDYAGFIPHADEPVEIGNAQFKAYIGRHEENHHHGARRVIITVGGGITEAEIQMVEQDGYGDAFVISADWIYYAVEERLVGVKQVIKWLTLHVDIADGIADGVQHTDSVRVYNANRLGKNVADFNHDIVTRMLRGNKEN